MEMKILKEGTGEIFCKNTPSEVRKWTRENKPRALKDNRMRIKDAVKKFISDGYYLAIGGFGHIRIPMAIIYEIVRQRIKNLSVAGNTAVHFISNSFIAFLKVKSIYSKLIYN